MPSDLWQALRSRDDDVPASSPRVPDARRGARPPLGVVGASTKTRSRARSRPRSASSRSWTSCESPPRPPTPDVARDRSSASQGPPRQQGRRPDPARDRRAHEADVPATSPRVPDARRAARPTLGVVGSSRTTTRSPARSRSNSATSTYAPSSPATTSSRRAARGTAAILTPLPLRLTPPWVSSASATTPRRRRRCEFPPRPRRPARRSTAPRRRRELRDNEIIGPIPAEIGQLTKLQVLRVPPASPTPGAARDRSSASQGPHRQQDRRPDPARDRPAHGAEGAASSPRVPDARRAARPPLGVVGVSPTTRSTARSRPSSASSRR